MIDPDAKGQERRRHPRTHVRMPLQCVFLEPDGPRVMDRVNMFDISRGGIGGLSDRRYYPGQRVVVCMPVGGDDGLRSLYAKVVRCQAEREGGYQVGLEFDAASLGGWQDAEKVVRAAA